jgi:hypothetical protein
MANSEQSRKSDDHAAGKRQYATPRLTEYGDLRLRTLNRGPAGMGDGGLHPNNKTGD